MKQSDFTPAQVKAFRLHFFQLLNKAFGKNAMRLSLESAQPFWLLCRPQGWETRIHLNYKPLLGAPHIVDIECYRDLEYYAGINPPTGAVKHLRSKSVSFSMDIPEIDIRAPFEENAEALAEIVARMAFLKAWFEGLE